jgi:glycosyltransferase involved in cell wall biosynthesis
MLGVQSRDSRTRGIGRYGRGFLSALLALDSANEYVFYAHNSLPTDQFPDAPNAEVIRVPSCTRSLADEMDRLVTGNPQQIDALLLLNAYELTPGYGPPAKPLNGVATMAVVHDLIPFLFHDKYLTDPIYARRFYRRLERMRQYDLLLTNSEATRADCLRLLSVPDRRVVAVGAAADREFFVPDRSLPFSAATIETLFHSGVIRPFVFCLSGMDDRKNLWGLIDAFGMLPPEIRAAHQLVITCEMTEAYEQRVKEYALNQGVASQLVLTGAVPDSTLRIFYQRCSAFVSPSLYEGFGLPLLEAMHCGAVVIGGNNSSQIEVIGNGGILSNVVDPGDLATHLLRVLTDPILAATYRKQAVEQAKRFSWQKTAAIALDAMRSALRPRRRARRLRADRGHDAKPRLAVFSPWPPKGSGIADYAQRLVIELKPRYIIDLYHEPGYVPDVGLRSPDFACYDYRLFERNERVLGYRGVIHQMGNSFYHGFVYESIQKYGGIVTLHDFCLSGFQFWLAHQRGEPMENLRREVQYCYPGQFSAYEPQLWSWTEERGGFQDALARRGLHLNRRVFEHARAVVVHSPWCHAQAEAMGPEYGSRTFVIPLGTTARLVAKETRAAIRKKYGLAPESLIVGSFGILTQGKMNNEAVLAFQALARERRDAKLIFVGEDWEGGDARRKVDELGLSDRVEFLGRQPAEAFDALLSVADIGISLRRPPTYGETSAALLQMLGSGVPTIVNDVGTFSGYPDDVVRKVRMSSDGIDGLARALRELAADPAKRQALGEAARRYVEQNHAWQHAASLYAEVIERVHAEKSEKPRKRRSSSLALER